MDSKMSSHELLVEGFQLLDNLLEGDIEERIEYLEKCLEAYKLILQYKQVLRQRPPGLDLNYDKQDKHVGLADILHKYLSNYPEGRKVKVIINETKLNKDLTRQTLNRRVDLFTRVSYGVYKIRNGDANALYDTQVGSRDIKVGNSSLQS